MDFQEVGSRHRTHRVELTEEDKETIEQEVLNRTPRRQIYEMLSGKSRLAIDTYIAKVRKKHKLVVHVPPKPKIILQYNEKGELVAKYHSYIDAWRATGVREGCISRCCRGLQKRAGIYYWKLEEEGDNVCGI